MEILYFLKAAGMKTAREEYVPIITARYGHEDMLRYALEHEFHEKHADPSAILCYALFTAIAHGQIGTTGILLQHMRKDAKLELCPQTGSKVALLLVAVDAGSVAMVRHLFSIGAHALDQPCINEDFSASSRLQRHKVLTDTWRSKLGLMSVYTRWEYEIHQNKVKKALSAAMAQDRRNILRDQSQLILKSQSVPNGDLCCADRSLHGRILEAPFTTISRGFA